MLYGISGNGHRECMSDIVEAMEDINQWRGIHEWNDNKRNTWLNDIIKLLSLISGGNLLGLIDDIIKYKHEGHKILDVLPSLQKYHNVCDS